MGAPLKFNPMPYRLRAVLMLLAILWQSLVMVGPLAVSDRGQEFEHAVLHAQAADHHHHDDLSVHVENADGAAQHLHADGGFNNPAWLPVAGFEPSAAQLLAPIDRTRAAAASSDLDRLLRPPKRHA